MLTLLLLAACSPEPSTPGAGGVLPGDPAPMPGIGADGAPPVPGAPAPGAPQDGGGASAASMMPPTWKVLSPTDTAGKLNLTIVGASDVTVDFSTATDGGVPTVIVQEHLSGSSGEIAVPAARAGKVWVSAWKDAKGDGPDPEDAVGYASAPISFDVPTNSLTLELGVGKKPPAGTPFEAAAAAAPPVPAAAPPGGTTDPSAPPPASTAAPGTAPPAADGGAPPPPADGGGATPPSGSPTTPPI